MQYRDIYESISDINYQYFNALTSLTIKTVQRWAFKRHFFGTLCHHILFFMPQRRPIMCLPFYDIKLFRPM